MDLYGSFGDDLPDIPEHVGREMDAEATAYETVADQHAGIWLPESWRERLARRWRHRRQSTADVKAAAATRAEAVTSAHCQHDYPRYFAALEDVRRADGQAAMQRVLEDDHQHVVHELRAREFERQSTYLLPSERVALARQIFQDDDTAEV